MITIWIKKYIKNDEAAYTAYDKRKIALICGIVGIVLNVILFIVKYVIGMLSGSVSIMADAFNNITDAGTAVAMMLGIRIASYGSGERHPSGHGRFEWIISSLMAFLVMNVGFKLFGDSITTIGNKASVSISIPMLLIMTISIGVKSYMYLYNRKYGKLIDSEAMNAVAKDSISDAVATFTVILSAILSMIIGINMDGYCGILVSLFIIYNGFMALCETAGRIIGSSPERSELMLIKEIILKGNFFTEVMELRVEDYGMGREKAVIKAGYLENRDNHNLQKEMERIRTELYREKGYEVLIMPVKTEENEVTRNLNEQIRKYMKQRISFSYIENFYMVETYEEKHIYVDIVIPKSQEKQETEITKDLQKLAERVDNTYCIFPQYRIFHDIREKEWAGDKRAKKYDSFMESCMFPKNFGGSIEKHHTIMKELLQSVIHKNVLDIGCGSGDTANFLNTDNQYLGIDISKSLLDIAREKLQQKGFQEFQCQCDNAFAMEIPDSSKDVVICNLAMQMLEPTVPFLMEVKRVMKADGIFIGSVPVIDYGKRRFRYNSDISTSKKLKNLLEDKGFQVDMMEKVNGTVCYFKATLKGTSAHFSVFQR